MKLASLLLTTPIFASLCLADWNMWSGSCNSGSGHDPGWETQFVSTSGQGACGNGGTIIGNIHNSQFETQDPCGRGKKIKYIYNGRDMNIYVDNKQVGVCHTNVNRMATSCNKWNSACILNRHALCRSSYCG